MTSMESGDKLLIYVPSYQHPHGHAPSFNTVVSPALAIIRRRQTVTFDAFQNHRVVVGG
jgi:hypothetical protein